MTVRYARRPGPRSEQNERLRQRLSELADERKRWGYPPQQRKPVAGDPGSTAAWLLEREGWQLNIKRVYRIYAEEQ